jgi:SAM-dependent methyltransferase
MSVIEEPAIDKPANVETWDTDNFGVPIVCPQCKGQLKSSARALVCGSCKLEFPCDGGYPDLVVGQRYDDDTPDDEVRGEGDGNRATAQRFWIPLFKKLWDGRPGTLTILSLGCGVGADVDQLCSAGFRAVGIDNGKRAAAWIMHRPGTRFFRANGQHMPFEDETFDFAYCGCVFPHVGVQGITYNVTQDYYEQRLALAMEMVRVVKKGGRIISCNPNRNFPFDIFHGHRGGKFTARRTHRSNPLLLSAKDYEHLFGEAGCRKFEALPVDTYWGFTGSSRTLKGRILTLPVRFIFWLVSLPQLKFLRASMFNPWLIMMMEK